MASSTKFHTILKREETNLEWTIHNLNLIAVDSIRRISQNFKIDKINKTCLLTLKAEKRGTLNTYLFRIHLEDCKEFENCSVDVQLLHDTNKKIRVKRHTTRMENDGKKILEYTIDTTELKTDLVVITCSLKYLTMKTMSQHELEIWTEHEEFNKICKEKCPIKNCDELYKNQQLCDLIIKIGDEKIKAHSVILAAASSYFMAMFSHSNTKENIERTVDLTEDSDVTVSNFRAFLDYIYGNKSLSELADLALELLILADKFDVLHLRRCCESYLAAMLSTDNVIETLIFSHRYNCACLKKKAIAFAKASEEKIEALPKSGKLFCYPDLMIQLF